MSRNTETTRIASLSNAIPSIAARAVTADPARKTLNIWGAWRRVRKTAETAHFWKLRNREVNATRLIKAPAKIKKGDTASYPINHYGQQEVIENIGLAEQDTPMGADAASPTIRNF